MADKIIEGIKARDFADFLQELDHGNVNQRLSEKLLMMSGAVQEVGQKGTITLTLTFTREGQMCKVDAGIVSKLPEHPQHGSLFFWGEGGDLRREDPRQLKLRNLSQIGKPKIVQPDDPGPDSDDPNPRGA